MNRRHFLKLAGISAAAGIGGPWALRLPGEVLEASESPAAAGGKRLAMVIDVSKFRSDAEYQKCISACHDTHNVPDLGNPKHEIKWIWREEFDNTFAGIEHPFLSEGAHEAPFMVLCNHCQNPPCVRVCPTQATFKRKSDGVVMMDYHRCIGCRFCMAGCPYGARSFNWRDPRPFIDESTMNRDFPTRTKGVVEKCNFCAERLAKDLEPACVEAAKENGALIFGDLGDPNSEVREILRSRYTLRRKPELGTQPNVYYVIGGLEHAG